tara:strand:- start:388 stop:765 length:378 start_codon:yes stop_codon:yes gene_type:complete
LGLDERLKKMPIDPLQTQMMKDEFCLQITHEKNDCLPHRVIIWVCVFKGDSFICQRTIYKTQTLRNGHVSEYIPTSYSGWKVFSIPRFESHYKMWVKKGCHLSWGEKIDDLPLNIILDDLGLYFP